MNAPLSLAGRTALIAGGAGGIGAAITRRFQQAGATTIVVDRDDATPPEGARFVPCDLTDANAVTAMIAGIDPLHIVVHAAGVSRDAVLWKMTDPQWNDVMRVNLDSAFYLLRAVTPVLRRAGDGSIILVASINGERGKRGLSNYAASKAGLIGLGRTAARELGAFGIRVNMISPGYIRTPMTQHLPEAVFERAREETVLGRLGEPDDVACVALFLASDLSRHVAGQVIRVDGGQLIG
ncbi:MAG TPA: SDR family oxidoreductase [Candidatus Krumholzibacteria bacterium]